ncbi:alanine:cation symporter family protein [Corynebacterium sp. sy017]|uniref:alanine/glycine:cation symporter family protein n=1 Tax=unclassified Corynebacterium TaxID=2624378 RepID=UPI00118706A1|nr:MULTISPECIES: alanine/glycine:cation symporter family protein [unclassified Corynebacterium]MBP3087883.1 alanine:cation symporter family protein [Corynebacterium sp. sy017]QDZ42851.1 alanine:cation symporter family protein [Corynebacterium sp. sy039]TSD92424.1 alanine:cation symporter family protein [Corynebacterium sp. SY003]
MNSVESFVETMNHYIWLIVPWVLIGAGVYFAVRTFFVQVRYVPDMIRSVSEKNTSEDSHTDDEGISAFKAFCISAAARVGTGNIVGVAVAISAGGPGAVFWMWMIAIIGGATAFVESTLAQLWKVKEADGTYRGGPAYYMTKGLGLKGLATCFAIAITITYGFVYNSIQANSITEAIGTSINNSGLGFRATVGLVLAVITGIIIFGGIKRIANFTQVIVPVMALLYLGMGLVVLILNISHVPAMFAEIVTHALGIREIAGATLGAAFQYGMRRGLFSNEAGQGSAPNAAATASVSHPVKQGLVQTLGVYFDTLLVCSITAFIILLSSPTYTGAEQEGAPLAQRALAQEVGGFGIHFITLILFFLAFSSVIGNYYLAQANVEYFTQSRKALTVFRVLVVLCVFGGAIGSVNLVWSLGDTFAALMVFINVIAIVPLGGVAVKLLRNYSQQKRKGVDPVFHRDMLPEVKNIEVWDGSDPVTRRGGAVVTEV